MSVEMLNMTVGPVMADEHICQIGAKQVPYFRTDFFSQIIRENELCLCGLSGAAEGSRAVFLTGSGTAAMEAAVLGLFSEDDKVLVINGGTFGERFAKICDFHSLNYTQLKLQPGEAVGDKELAAYDPASYDAVIVNLCETSTGTLHDIEALKRFCDKGGAFLLVDAISAYLCDEIDMEAQGIDALIIGSQKALALPPGISALVLNKRAQERIEKVEPKSFYLDLRSALKDGERGQTPFTPAVSILMQMHERLLDLSCQGKDYKGGAQKERERIAALAQDFRERIQDLGLELLSQRPSHSVTALKAPEGVDATQICKDIERRHGIWICPNGGELSKQVFRVGHMGALSIEDNKRLVDALRDLKESGWTYQDKEI